MKTSKLNKLIASCVPLQNKIHIFSIVCISVCRVKVGQTKKRKRKQVSYIDIIPKKKEEDENFASFNNDFRIYLLYKYLLYKLSSTVS